MELFRHELGYRYELRIVFGWFRYSPEGISLHDLAQNADEEQEKKQIKMNHLLRRPGYKLWLKIGVSEDTTHYAMVDAIELLT